jgi:hypothetical protein
MLSGLLLEYKVNFRESFRIAMQLKRLKTFRFTT